MNSENLTIKQFAKKAGVSTQYVYKQIREGKLTEYTEIVDGKKYLKPEALEKIGKQKQDNQIQTNEQTIVSFLQEQLKEKDRQIAELQEMLKQSQELLRIEKVTTERRILMLEEQITEQTDGNTAKAEEAFTGQSEADSGRSEKTESVAGGADRNRSETNPKGLKQTKQKPETFWKRLQKAIRG